MPNITLSISQDLHEMIKRHREIRWSEIARVAIVDQTKKLELMDKIASKSKLTVKDIEKINKKIKKNLRSSMTK